MDHSHPPLGPRPPARGPPTAAPTLAANENDAQNQVEMIHKSYVFVETDRHFAHYACNGDFGYRRVSPHPGLPLFTMRTLLSMVGGFLAVWRRGQ
ncbi:hypothetical protein EVAR_60954_1 [Eumeta japonica]|uniref:Uncharacterized protein n=1 Tax=Eumeta variegata TaxID=151549 RepID=A0A4C1XXD3_EUMVA|nr:hypothetical protein EVAR_60954_1 [Eumeta japonica]